MITKAVVNSPRSAPDRLNACPTNGAKAAPAASATSPIALYITSPVLAIVLSSRRSPRWARWATIRMTVSPMPRSSSEA